MAKDKPDNNKPTGAPRKAHRKGPSIHGDAYEGGKPAQPWRPGQNASAPGGPADAERVKKPRHVPRTGGVAPERPAFQREDDTAGERKSRDFDAPRQARPQPFRPGQSGGAPGRPPFTGARPQFNGVRPPAPGGRPTYNPSNPSRRPFNGPRSPYNADAPGRPPMNGPRPPFNGPRSPYNPDAPDRRPSISDLDGSREDRSQRGVRGSGKNRPPSAPFSPNNRSLNASQKASRPSQPHRTDGMMPSIGNSPGGPAPVQTPKVEVAPLTAAVETQTPHVPQAEAQAVVTEVVAVAPAAVEAIAAPTAEVVALAETKPKRRTTKIVAAPAIGTPDLVVAPELVVADEVHAAAALATAPQPQSSAATVTADVVEATKPVAKKVIATAAPTSPVAKAAAKDVDVDSPALPGFSELGLSQTILDTIAKAGFELPTAIQARAIPILVSGRDMIGQAQTGTGKTGAFALPLLDKIERSNPTVQAIVLAPTRELAVQVASSIHAFSTGLGVRTAAVYGGQPIDRQFRALREGAQIVVGTPGRILDHLRRGTLNLSSVKMCVLDEADEMLALGFLEEVESVLKELPPEHQTALFSATFSPRVQTLAKSFMRQPATVAIESRRRTVDTTRQIYYDVPHGKKQDALARVLDMETPGPTIVFCRTRLETEELAEALRLRGYGAEALNGDMGQSERERVLKRFREGQADLLVATDVAARGLDIDGVTHVINYDIPWDVEQYIHRVGRTGRAGKTGDAITLVTPRERRQLLFIEQTIGAKISSARIPTVADIAARRRQRFKEALVETIAAGDNDGYMSIVGELAEDNDPSEIAAAALKMLWKTMAQNAAPIDEDASQDTSVAAVGMARLFIGLGRQDGLRPADIVGALTREIGMDGRRIGAIDILDRSAFVEVPIEEAQDVVTALRKTRLRNRKVAIQYAGPDQGAQPRNIPL